MRFTLVSLALLCTPAMLLACQGRTSPAEPFPPVTAPVATSLGTPLLTDGIATTALGLYTLTIDPGSLQATVELREVRAGQANDDLYALSIDNFLRRDSLRIRGIAATADTVDVTYVVEHPFPAPSDPTGVPNGSTNRADLGIAGMVCFLTDVVSATGNTYFSDRVANTALVTNADAYYSPGQLLNLGTVANTFPYRQLVDELADNSGSRLGVFNGGDPTGNYGADGWTRSEFGPTNNGWTGYGVLHQGQASMNTVSLAKPALSAGFSLDVAILAKYNDPRGGGTPAEKKANRLPPATADASLFAYRMPHGALDVSRIAVLPVSGDFVANQISAATLSVHIDDWDARATETAAGELSADPVFTNVAVGASGVPTVEVCIPGVLSAANDPNFTAAIATVIDDDSAFGGDATQDAGAPGDPLCFSELITKGAIGGQTPGIYTGMYRVADVQQDDWSGLDPDLNLLPSPPAATTYQAFSITLGTGNAAPAATVAVTTPTIAPGTSVSISVSSVRDAEGDPIDILVDWDDDGTYTLTGTLNSPYPGSSPFTSPITYTFTAPAPDLRDLPVRLDDGLNVVDITPMPTFEVLASSCPTPVPPKTATDITSGMWDTTAGVGASYWVGPTGTAPWPSAWTHPGTASAAFHGGTFAGNPAGFIGQGISTTDGFFDFVRIRPGALVTTPPIVQIVTNMDSTPTSPLFNRQAADVEIDRTNRVIFTLRNAGTFSTAGSVSFNYSGANSNWFWFDYNGSSVVGDAGFNTVTTPSPIVALALDKDNNVFALDNQHILRKYVRNGATAYTQVTTAPYPLDLKLAPISIGQNSGTGAANRKIHDFAISWYNGAMFFLVEHAATGPADGWIYRVECDGTFSPTLSGNPNPRALTLAESSAQAGGCDLEIDHLNAAGLPGAHEDVQLFVIGFNAAGTPDEFILNSNLVVTHSYDATTTGSKASFGYSDGTGWPNNVRMGGNGNGSFRLYYPTPPGWQ